MSEITKENETGQLQPRWWRVLTIIGIGFIALGNASDATLLIRELGADIYSYVSNDFEYQTLASVNVGNTVDYIEERLGKPQVSRAVGNETSANYFHDDKYLLTVFYRSGRVEAFTWISLNDGFEPEITTTNGKSTPIGKTRFTQLPRPVTEYAIDDSRIIRYYIEALEGSRDVGFLGTYLGHIQYGAFAPADSIGKLYAADVNGQTDTLQSAWSELRNTETPNLYGRGNLPLTYIEKSILSNAEFAGYFGTD